jgi:hypothetical protein
VTKLLILGMIVCSPLLMNYYKHSTGLRPLKSFGLLRETGVEFCPWTQIVSVGNQLAADTE